MYPGGFSGDPSYITDVWDLCGGRSADGSCCLWHKKQKRDFTGSREQGVTVWPGMLPGRAGGNVRNGGLVESEDRRAG